MLNTFSFDLCSSGENLVYRRVPELFGNHEQVPLTPPCFVFLWHAPLPSLRRSCHRRSPPMPRSELHLQLLHRPRVISPRSRPLSSPFLASRARATTPRAISGRHLLAVVDSSLPRLNLFPLARSSTTLTPTCCFATPSTQFRATEPHSLAAVFLRSGRAQHARGQPSPAHPRPNQHLH
jgi:hypothetical protein